MVVETPAQTGLGLINLAHVAQHQNGLLQPLVTEANGFRQAGHRKGIGTPCTSSFSGGAVPMAIAIGLDHSHEFHMGTNPLAQ